MDTIIPNHQTAPDFTLFDLQNRPHSLHNLRGKIAVLNFWSAECPWSEQADQKVSEFLKKWGERVAVWNIASNANEPVDLLQKVAAERRLPVVLHDAGHQVADLYGAITTPHIFVLDAQGILRYQGAFNDVTFRQRTATRCYLRDAVDALLAGKAPGPESSPAYGCTIVRYNPG